MTDMATTYDTETADYDYLTFEQRDVLDELAAESLREFVWDLPARPGTLR